MIFDDESDSRSTFEAAMETDLFELQHSFKADNFELNSSDSKV